MTSVHTIERVQFVRHKVAPHRRHYVDEEDVKVVLSRMPEELWARLRKVHFKDDARGNRKFGYTTNRGRHEITLCAMPHQKTVRRRTMGGEEFGALRGCQWPVRAIRRFMLYDVFLHELGHLQIVRRRSANPNRKFASETLAQEFANTWRRKLWSEHFDHEDPVHNSPTAAELKALQDGWVESNLAYRKGQSLVSAGKHGEAIPHLQRAIERYPEHAQALYLLGRLTYFGLGFEEHQQNQTTDAAAAEYLSRSVAVDHAAPDANLLLAAALSRRDQASSRRYFERAVQLDARRGLARAIYAQALSRWGCEAEAEAHFAALVKTSRPVRWLALMDYATHLLLRAGGDPGRNARKAAVLLREALSIDPSIARVHYELALAYQRLNENIDEAVQHLEQALRLSPGHEQAAALLRELTPGDRNADAGRPA